MGSFTMCKGGPTGPCALAAAIRLFIKMAYMSDRRTGIQDLVGKLGYEFARSGGEEDSALYNLQKNLTVFPVGQYGEIHLCHPIYFFSTG